MDQETREFLQEHLGRIGERLDGFDQRFETIDQRFERVDRRFDALEEETRHTRVLVEGLHTRLQAVAEGFATVDSKIGQTAASLRDEVEEDRSRNTQLHRHHERRITDVERRVDLLEATED